ncbi:hypothetical protein PAA26_06770 [Methanomassiliicoccaceae archaeon COG_1]|nr:hypothetical protein [Methanomassiliicoccaceae archaeon COG_1]
MYTSEMNRIEIARSIELSRLPPMFSTRNTSIAKITRPRPKKTHPCSSRLSW